MRAQCEPKTRDVLQATKDWEQMVLERQVTDGEGTVKGAHSKQWQEHAFPKCVLALPNNGVCSNASENPR